MEEEDNVYDNVDEAVEATVSRPPEVKVERSKEEVKLEVKFYSVEQSEMSLLDISPQIEKIDHQFFSGQLRSNSLISKEISLSRRYNYNKL